MRDALDRCAAGELSVPLALMRLFLAAPDEAAARGALEAAIGGAQGEARENLEAMRVLWADTPGAFALVRRVGEAGAGGAIEDWRDLFDRAASVSPEAGVALYSLGRPDLLAEATNELVALLEARGLLSPEARALDMGCGIGRVAGAVAPHAAHVTGADVSPVMLDEARRRVVAPNVTFIQGDGRGLPLPDAAFDLVLAVDMVPYLVASGAEVLETNLREVHRVLRPAGRLLVFNFSYRGGAALDRADAMRLADAIGFRLVVNGERPLRIWDGMLFDFEKG